MTRTNALLTSLVLVLVACGGDEGGVPTAIGADGGGGEESSQTTEGDDSGGAAVSGAVVDRQPPGQAKVSVDGLEYTLTEPGGVGCSVAPDAITISFIIGDNEIVLGGGLSRFDTGWLGDVVLRVANPESEPGPVSYSTDVPQDGTGLAIEGASVSYVGPMLKQPANDGSNPPQVDVGEGTISATCP